jgi:hypothetical protein
LFKIDGLIIIATIIMIVIIVQVKLKVHPTTCHEGPEGE